MKLCRFLYGDDAKPRSGVFANGKIYETDGTQALGTHKPEDVILLAPVSHAPTIRTFSAFRPPFPAENGGDMRRTEWGRAPMFYFGNPTAFTGPDVGIRRPETTQELDYELQVVAIIGEGGTDIGVDEADSHILGFSILNAWTARDAERRELPVGLGSGKARDFATSLGPFLVTPEELEQKIVDRERGIRYNLKLQALVNGEIYSEANLREMKWTFAEMIAEASRGAQLSQGDLIASGCTSSGSLQELGKDYLEPGDEVSLVVELLGKLTNSIT